MYELIMIVNDLIYIYLFIIEYMIRQNNYELVKRNRVVIICKVNVPKGTTTGATNESEPC